MPTETRVLFARSHVEQDEIDGFDREIDALEELHIEFAVATLERLMEADGRDLEGMAPGPALLRSFILSEDEYATVFEVCFEHGVTLLSDPEAYANAMYLPRWVDELGDLTPRTVCTEDDAPELALELAKTLTRPLFVRDHLKSAKEDWEGACFIPEGASDDDFLAILRTLKAVRGDLFSGGYAVREFIDLKPLPYREGRRVITEEHRVAVVNGEVAAHAPYHDLDVDRLTDRALELIPEVVRRVGLEHFCVDLARRRDGRLCVMELNALEVVRLPEQMDPRELYRALV